MKKRIISLLLAVLMIVSLLPTMALADGEHQHDGITFTAWTSDNSLPDSPGNYYLTKDVTLSVQWTVPNGTTNLCLNGYVIIGPNSSTGGYEPIVLSGSRSSILNLYDCDTRKTEADFNHEGYFTDGYKWHFGAIPQDVTGTSYPISGGIVCINPEITNTNYSVVNLSGGSFTMNGGTLVGMSGKGVGMRANTVSFTMNGGAICGCGKGGVVVNGNFTMNDGCIFNNYSDHTGGGVAITATGENYGSFTMNGGSIYNNIAYYHGGGVGVSSTGTNSFTMNGGRIYNNCCKPSTYTSGGGVYIIGNAGASFTVGGTARIDGNTEVAEGKVLNVYVSSGKTITLGNGTNGAKAPADGMSIGVTTQTAPVSDAPVPFTSSCSSEDAQYFFADNASKYSVQFNTASNYLELIDHAHSFTTFEGRGSTITAICANTDENCPLTECKVSLSLVEDPASATGVSMSGASGWTSCGLTLPTIEYAKYTDDVLGDYSAEAPAEAGKYSAKIDYTPAGGDTYTATQDFSIAGHTVTVLCGDTATPSTGVLPGTTVTISAPAQVTKDDAGKQFDKWTTTDASVANSSSATTTFTMPNQDVEVTANYVDCYPFVVKGSDGAVVSSSPEIEEALVTATAPAAPQHYAFEKWTAEGITLTSTQETTTPLTISMPANKLVLTAKNKMLGIKIPTEDPTIFTYNGAEKTYQLRYTSDSEFYTLTCSDSNVTIDGTTAKATKAGTYTLTATLNSEDLVWTDETKAPKTFTFTVNKMKIDKPIADPRKFIYDGYEWIYYAVYKINNQYYDYSDIFYTISNNKRTEVGTQTVTVKPMENFCWDDGTETPLTFEFKVVKALQGYVYYLKDKRDNNKVTNYIDLSAKLYERPNQFKLNNCDLQLSSYYTPNLKNVPSGTKAVYYLWGEEDGEIRWDDAHIDTLAANSVYFLYAKLTCPGYESQTTDPVPIWTSDRPARTVSYKKYKVEEGGADVSLGFKVAIPNSKRTTGLLPIAIFPFPKLGFTEDRYEQFNQRSFDFSDALSLLNQMINDLGSDCEDVMMLNYKDGQFHNYPKGAFLELYSLRQSLLKSSFSTAMTKSSLLEGSEPVFDQSYIEAYMKNIGSSKVTLLPDEDFNVPLPEPQQEEQAQLIKQILDLGTPIENTLRVYTILYDPQGTSQLGWDTVPLREGTARLCMGDEEPAETDSYPTYNLMNYIPSEIESQLDGYELNGVYGEKCSAEKLARDPAPRMCDLSFGEGLYEWDMANDTVDLRFDVTEDYDGDKNGNRTQLDNTVYIIYQKKGTTDWTTTAEVSLKAWKNATATLQLPAIHKDAAYGTVTSTNDKFFTIDQSKLSEGKLVLKAVKDFDKKAESDPLSFTVDVIGTNEKQQEFLTYPITVTVIPDFQTSGGGDSTPAVTVPVTGDGNSVKVSASVSGSTATVKEIKDADLAKVAGGEIVEIDLSGLNKNIDTAKLPTETVEKIADKDGMSVKLSTATVTFDKAATQEIASQADGSTIQLVVDDIKEVSLNAVQKESVKKLDTALIIDAYLVSNGTKLCTENKGGFGSGKATVALPFEIKNNRTAANYSVFYVDDAGNLQKLNAVYDKKLAAFVFEIEHFSVYAVAYDENGMPFTDVAAGEYFYDAVKWAVASGITDGTDATHFSPGAPVTRAQVVTFLWRAAGKPVVNYYMNMSDVKSGEYYSEAVRWALSEGITKGTSDTTFSPDKVCTRGQIVTFLARFAGVKDEATGYTHGFTDVEATDYFNNAVAWAKDNKVTEGTSATTFSPYTNCNRAQVVTFLYRWMVK